jgi:hypothetical protein
MSDLSHGLGLFGFGLVALGLVSQSVILWRDGAYQRQYIPPLALFLALMQASGLALQLISSSSLVEFASDRRASKPSIVFNSPVKMYEGDIDTAELVIEKGSQDSILNSLRELHPKDAISDDRATDTMILEKSFPIIVATLEGIGFTIVPSGPQKRQGEFRWSWQIKAEQNTIPSLKGDDRLLSIRLEGQIGTGPTARVTLLKGPQPRRVHVVPKTITLVQQVIDWLKELNPYVAGIAAALVAAFGWLSRSAVGRMWRRFKNGPDFDET